MNIDLAITMSSVAELTAVGEKFGYAGEQLRDFVRQEQARERDERAADRELEKAKLAQADADRAERERRADADRELEKVKLAQIDADREQRERQAEYDREIERAKLKQADQKLAYPFHDDSGIKRTIFSTS